MLLELCVFLTYVVALVHPWWVECPEWLQIHWFTELKNYSFQERSMSPDSSSILTYGAVLNKSTVFQSIKLGIHNIVEQAYWHIFIMLHWVLSSIMPKSFHQDRLVCQILHLYLATLSCPPSLPYPQPLPSFIWELLSFIHNKTWHQEWKIFVAVNTTFTWKKATL